MTRRLGKKWRTRATGLAFAASLSLVVASCAPTITVHGYVPTPSQVEDITPGIDTRLSVEDRIGRPASTGLLRDSDWYYVQSTMEQLTYNPPRTTDRKVVAIAFDEEGVVTSVQTYGLEDGKIINLSPRITPTAGQRENVLLRIFAGVLNFDAEGLLGDQ